MRPFQHLPIKFPSEFDPSEHEPDFFYKNFIKPMIPDMIKMTDVGLHIDQEAVESLRKEVKEVLGTVTSRLSNNKLIQQYKEHIHPILFKEFKADIEASKRSVGDYIKEYRPKDMVHRTYVVNNYFRSLGKDKIIQDKWTVKDLKATNIFTKSPFIDQVIQGTVSSSNKFILAGMLDLANEKVRLWNIPRDLKIANGIEVPDFNPASAKQKKELFTMLGIESSVKSKTTNEDSWGRDSIEQLLKTTEDENLMSLLEVFVDHSYSAIIRNNFLAAFDSFSVDGILHGNIKLGGAKTWRNTSNSPSLLNMPASNSRFAKPLKKCFVAPEGMLVAGIDLDQLEERILVNITKDKAKLAIFENGYDSHMYNCIHYGYPELDGCKEQFYSSEDKEKYLIGLKKKFPDIRNKSKSVTFKLNYLGHPDEHKGGKVTQDIYDNYHKLYVGVKNYRENIIIPATRDKSYLHMGCGARLYSDDVDTHIRTLHNACFQFYSIITLITINEINYQIALANYEKDIQVVSTIYDSIYFNVTKNCKIIKWLNDTLVPIITTPIFKEELIGNAASLAIANNWAELEANELPNGCDIKTVKSIVDSISI